MAATWKKLTAQADQRSEEDRQRVVVSETVKREATRGVSSPASALGVILFACLQGSTSRYFPSLELK